MLRSTDAAHLQHQIEAQRQLAGLATIDRIRAMHEDLEQLYHTRLVALLLAEQLAVTDVVLVMDVPGRALLPSAAISAS